MKILISPTKQMRFDKPLPDNLQVLASQYADSPRFAESADLLNSLLKQYGKDELMTLMKMSSTLAESSIRSIQNFGNSEIPGQAALFSYSGTVFQFIEGESFTPGDLLFAQEHLRILSGLYGVLKPLDEIQPYRLEMKTPLQVPGSGPSLGSYWKDVVTETLVDEEIILNLASDEYFRIIDRKRVKGRILTLIFKEETDGGLRTVGMYAKKARGVMVRRIIQEKITNPELLKTDIPGGYSFREDLSRENEWIFIR